MPKSEQINELVSALVKAQAEMDFAKKDAENPFFKSSYADLPAVMEVCRAVLPKNGLAVIQTLDYANDRIVLVTMLAHTSGQWVSGELSIRPVKDDPQAVGSAITYARRYSLAAIVGVVADDDDGEGAMDRKAKAQPRPSPPAPLKKEPPKSEPIKPVDLEALEDTLWAMNEVEAIKAMMEKSRARIEKDKNKVQALDLFSARLKELEEDA